MRPQNARPRRVRVAGGARGFTLLEMIAALALLSLAMLALAAGVGSALRTLLPSAHAIEAAQIAHARLDGVCVDPALHVGHATGSDAGARWTLDVTAAPRAPGASAAAVREHVQVLQARLAVSIGVRTYRFDTACATVPPQVP